LFKENQKYKDKEKSNHPIFGSQEDNYAVWYDENNKIQIKYSTGNQEKNVKNSVLKKLSTILNDWFLTFTYMIPNNTKFLIFWEKI